MTNPATVGGNNDQSNIAKLQDARDNYVQQIADISISPKPTYEIDGQKINWQEYQTYLQTQIRNLNALVNELDIANGDCEVLSQGYT